MNERLLIAIPLCTYLVSYLYLAYYHGKVWLFNTTVHEGGTYTLLQTMFYVSHFLGHIPVYTILAFLFTGTYLCLTGSYRREWPRKQTCLTLLILVIFLVVSFALSLVIFIASTIFEIMWQLFLLPLRILRYIF